MYTSHLVEFDSGLQIKLKLIIEILSRTLKPGPNLIFLVISSSSKVFELSVSGMKVPRLGCVLFNFLVFQFHCEMETMLHYSLTL